VKREMREDDRLKAGEKLDNKAKKGYGGDAKKPKTTPEDPNQTKSIKYKKSI